MTREEIEHLASLKYPAWMTEADIWYNKGLIEGLRTADANPKSPWISVKDDLPCNHPEMLHPNYTDKVLVLSRNGYSEVAFMCLIEGAWEWNTFIKVLYWMPIPEPPKE